jgi:hypothetical protein
VYGQHVDVRCAPAAQLKMGRISFFLWEFDVYD